MQKRTETAEVILRLDPVLREAAEKAAAADHLSLGSFIERLLADHLRERGAHARPSADRGTRPSELTTDNDD